jgi:transcriptional repressor NrdR
MHCPFCHYEDTRVIDSRLTEDGMQVRRRRECERCGERFNTYETADLKLPAIVKHDGRREAFDERKLRVGLERALQKRPVGSDAADTIVEHVIKKLRTGGERELPSRRIGEWVMAELKAIDQVAYVRFASVYRRFEDVQAFREEVERLERDLPALEGKQMSLLGEEPEPRKRGAGHGARGAGAKGDDDDSRAR